MDICSIAILRRFSFSTGTEKQCLKSTTGHCALEILALAADKVLKKLPAR